MSAVDELANRFHGSRGEALLRRLGVREGAYRAYERLCDLRPVSSRGRFLFEDVAGHQLVFDPWTGSEYVSITHTLAKERPVLEAFADAIEPGDVVWDVGANVGVFSALAMQVAGTHGMVVPVEPHPPTFDALQRNLAYNHGRFHELPFALDVEEGTVSFAVERNRPGTQTGAIGEDDERKLIDVDVRRADKLIDAFAPVPDVLKVDVEGTEARALRSFGDWLDEIRTVFVEAHSRTNQDLIELTLDRTHDVTTVYENGETYLRADRR